MWMYEKCMWICSALNFGKYGRICEIPEVSFDFWARYVYFKIVLCYSTCINAFSCNLYTYV